MEIIVTVKKTYQTSEDTWERALLTATFDKKEKIESIIEWVKSKDADIDTIKIHINGR